VESANQGSGLTPRSAWVSTHMPRMVKRRHAEMSEFRTPDHPLSLSWCDSQDSARWPPRGGRDYHPRNSAPRGRSLGRRARAIHRGLLPHTGTSTGLAPSGGTQWKARLPRRACDDSLRVRPSPRRCGDGPVAPGWCSGAHDLGGRRRRGGAPVGAPPASTSLGGIVSRFRSTSLYVVVAIGVATMAAIGYQWLPPGVMAVAFALTL
jgi:hypothetical protein